MPKQGLDERLFPSGKYLDEPVGELFQGVSILDRYRQHLPTRRFGKQLHLCFALFRQDEVCFGQDDDLTLRIQAVPE